MSQFEPGQERRLGCGYYLIQRTKTGHLKAVEISKDPECVALREKQRKQRIEQHKGK